MSAVLTLGLLASATAAGWRFASIFGEKITWIEVVVVGLATSLALTIVAGTGLAVAGVFSPLAVACLHGVTALASFPWRSANIRGLPRAPASRWAAVVLATVVLGGLALRLPAIAAPLAGRDQGTYELRARALLRTGSVDMHNPVLVDAGPDVRGLYPIDESPAHANRYEASYRPGAYLADREHGEIRPQFLHGHPAVVATFAATPLGMVGRIVFESVLSLLALWALCRRLWDDDTAWWVAAVAVTTYAISPIAIWVARTPLSEGPAAALSLAAAASLAVGARERDDRALIPAALTLGALAFVRGNAWIDAPVLVAVALLRPRPVSTTEPPFPWASVGLATYLALTAAGIVLHVQTSFPYVHDELRRLGLETGFDRLSQTSFALAAMAVVSVVVVVTIDVWLDRSGRRLGQRLAAVSAWLPLFVAAVVVLAVARYLAAGSPASSPPFSRLDPAVALLGPPLLALSGVGLSVFARPRPDRDTGDAWLQGLALVCATTMLLYAGRTLPQMGLYYYGRYLTPELLPAAILLACVALVWVTDRVEVTWLRRSIVGASAMLVSVVPAWVLVAAPQTRLREFEDAARAVTWLHERLPADAVVIAGGEGWHHGHTFNQVGGALEIAHGHPVLPYHSREAAYATMRELLVIGPARTGQPPPPVFLLVNEATKARTAKDGELEIGLDPGLFAPFVATRIDRVEMYVHRLTPAKDAIPTRVTRDVLRMALIEVRVDPSLAAQVIGVAADDLGDPARRCLEPEDGIRITLPDALREPGPMYLTLEFSDAVAALEGRVRVSADGTPLVARAPGARRRAHVTYGPWLLPEAPKRIAVRLPADARRDDGEACPFGALTAIHRLPLSSVASTNDPAPGETKRFEPPTDLGRPIPSARWVTARALSHLRPGTRPTPEVRGTGMVLEVVGHATFAPFEWPRTRDPERPWTAVVTLVGSHPGPDATLEVWVDDRLSASITPPADHKGSWQAPPFAVLPAATGWSTIELRLRGGHEDGYVLVRDVALFGPR